MRDGNAVFPINLTKENFNGTCESSCKLELLYAPSQCNCTNKDTYLSFSYDIYANKPVLFNSVYYDVSEVRIYSPSLHKYDGALCNGELVVLHIGTSGENLAICVPIIVNNGEFSTIDNIIDLASQSVQDYDQSATLNTDFNLSTLIPAVNHLYYRAITPFDCDTPFDICVFGNKGSSYIPIYSDQLKQLQNLIRGTNYNTRDDIRYKISMGSTKSEIRCIPLSSNTTNSGYADGFSLINNGEKNMKVEFEDIIYSENRISVLKIAGIAGGLVILGLFLKEVIKIKKK